MYTGTDVLIIVLFTMFATSIITMIIYSCIVVSGMESRDYETYMQGYIAGQAERNNNKN